MKEGMYHAGDNRDKEKKPVKPGNNVDGMYQAGDNRDKKGKSVELDDPGRREFLTTLGSGATLGALAMNAVSNIQNAKSLLSTEAREAIKRGDPETIATVRGLSRAYAVALGSEKLNGEEMERQLKSLVARNPGNHALQDVLKNAIQLSKEQQERYGRSMWELTDAVEPNLRQPKFKPDYPLSPKGRKIEG